MSPQLLSKVISKLPFSFPLQTVEIKMLGTTHHSSWQIQDNKQRYLAKAKQFLNLTRNNNDDDLLPQRHVGSHVAASVVTVCAGRDEQHQCAVIGLTSMCRNRREVCGARASSIGAQCVARARSIGARPFCSR